MLLKFRLYIQSVVTRIFSRMQAGCAALGTLRRNLAKLLLLLPLALILAAALSFGYDVAVSALKDVPQAAFSLRRTALFSPFTYFLLLHIIVRPRLIYSFCFRYRYLLAVLVFALCVVFELHGSSIGMYDIFIQPDAPKSSGAIPILGEARTIRADEWLKFTSMSLSQEFNNYAAISPITEAWPTSMVTLFGQPAWDLSTLAKPQFWGYLLFGSAKGLAWFWMGRLIALFLISFEFLRIFTNDNKYLSLTGAFLIALSPVVQWWYVMPHLTDILQSCFLAIILVHLLLKARQNNTKIACKTIMSIALGLCACGFILSLYPAWMIPAAYLFVLLMIIVICRTIRSLSKDARLRLSDFAYLAVAIAVAVVIIGYWYITQHDTITTIMNTAYPGARVNLGGKGSDILFNYVSNLLITFLPSFVPNQTEASEFLGLFPFTELLATALLVKRFIIYKNVDKTALVLLLLDLFLMIYIVFGFPEWLAKLTLLSSSLPTRALTFVTLLELLLLLHLAAHYKEALFKKKLATLICMAAIIALSLLFVYVARRVFIANSVPTSWLPIAYFVAFAIILALACLFIISKRTQFTLRCFTIVGITCALLGSILVNPVMQGIQAVTNKPLYSAVRQIQSNSPGIWISGDVLSNYLITAGAPTISSNNTIPILQRWHLFDSEGKYDYTYNRFASMELELTNEPTTFVLNVNQIILKLNIKDLETLGVNYLVTNSGVKLPNPKDSNWNGKLDPIYDEYGIIIYKVSY